jgi:hypothetical protein
MKLRLDTDKMVEKELDMISKKGEEVGAILGRIFRFLEKNFLGVVIIFGFGLLVFLYSLWKGFFKKGR